MPLLRRALRSVMSTSMLTAPIRLPEALNRGVGYGIRAAPARYLQVCPREERRIDENSSSSSLGRLGQRLACDRGPGLWTSAVNNLSELGTADTFASFNRQATVA